MRRIKIEQCPYNEGEQIFEKNSVLLHCMDIVQS